MYLRTEASDVRTDEYGGSFRRLYPWDGVATPPWGGAILTVSPGERSTPHSHDEEETFIFLEGTGRMHVDDETRDVGPGDVVYLPRFSTHCVVNDSDRPVSFLCVWWGAPEGDAATS